MMFKPGKSYLCTQSESPGYTKGRQYVCYKNSAGATCLRGDDGFEDLTTMLISKFVEAKLQVTLNEV